MGGGWAETPGCGGGPWHGVVGRGRKVVVTFGRCGTAAEVGRGAAAVDWGRGGGDRHGGSGGGGWPG